MRDLEGLRVGFLLDRWQPSRGGAETAMRDLAQHVAAGGATVLVFSDASEPGSLPEGGTWRRVPARGLTRARRERNLAHALVATARPECDVTVGMRHLPEVDLYWPHGGSHRVSLAARRASRGEPLEERPRGRHAVFLELERALLAEGGARRIVCVSELVRQELAAEYPACVERLVVVENGIDLERFHPHERKVRGRELRRSLGIAPKTRLLTFCAHEPVLKGLPVLLRALAGLDGEWRLLGAGMKDPGEWRDRAREAGVDESRVTFVSHVDPVALAAAGDLCVLPTWRDTSSLVVLESLAVGTPVVTTSRAGASGAVGKDSGELVEPGNAEELRLAVERWMDRPADRDSVRRCVAGRERARSLERIASIVRELAQ